MSEIQAKQDPATLARDNSRIVTFSRRGLRTLQPRMCIDQIPANLLIKTADVNQARFRENAPPHIKAPKPGSASWGSGEVHRSWR
jgi:hypothetical protein